MTVEIVDYGKIYHCKFNDVLLAFERKDDEWKSPEGKVIPFKSEFCLLGEAKLVG